MFRSSIAWREEIGLANILKEWRGDKNGGPRWKSARARMGDLCFYAGIAEARSLTGGPIMVERMGRMDLAGLAGDECESGID